MQLGFVGLGRMGAGMVARLRRAEHDVVAFDVSPEAVAVAERAGADGAATLAALAGALHAPRRVWVMVPAGEPVERTLAQLAELLEPGDLVVDGGNSNFHDTRRRAATLAERGIRLCDVGVSGGVQGSEDGYCLMAGGEAAEVEALRPALEALAPPGGWLHVGPAGAGHSAKMIHNGIEYGLLQAYGEGFALLRGARDFDFDLPAIAQLWNRGSVVRSWLLELAEHAFAQEGGELAHVRGVVEESGEGRWTVQEAIDQGTPAPVITLALLARFASRHDDAFSAKLIAALRHQFGGHPIEPE
jgi:6-phosphogluconate dehydrogenase